MAIITVHLNAYDVDKWYEVLSEHGEEAAITFEVNSLLREPIAFLHKEARRLGRKDLYTYDMYERSNRADFYIDDSAVAAEFRRRFANEQISPVGKGRPPGEPFTGPT